MVNYGFTGLQEGDMRDNIRVSKFLKGTAPRLTAIVRPRQVHGDHIEVVDATAKTDDLFHSFGGTDGLITRAKHTALTVLTADCVPLVLYDEKTGTIGISHQGWKGVLARLPALMVKKMVELGSRAPDIKSAIGPSINACCYEVLQERAITFRNEFKDSGGIVAQGNHFFLSLPQIVYEQLVESGIAELNIERSISCTSCQEDKYYSYRKTPDKSSFPEQVSYVVQY